jgi:hypothetical protein
MRSPKLLVVAVSATALVALAGAALAASPDPVDDRTSTTAEASPMARVTSTGTVADTSEVAEPSEGPGTTVEVAEPSEGPDTTVEVAEPYEGPGTTVEVAEPYEGPGTTHGPVHACLPIDGRVVCDTFGESDEGPGTR